MVRCGAHLCGFQWNCLTAGRRTAIWPCVNFMNEHCHLRKLVTPSRIDHQCRTSPTLMPFAVFSSAALRVVPSGLVPVGYVFSERLVLYLY